MYLPYKVIEDGRGKTEEEQKMFFFPFVRPTLNSMVKAITQERLEQESKKLFNYIDCTPYENHLKNEV